MLKYSLKMDRYKRYLCKTEAGGINLGGKRFCYDKTWIHSLVNKPAYCFRQDPQIIFMGIDPSGKTRTQNHITYIDH